MSSILISVLQVDIDNGTRGSNTKCPVALAVSRELGHIVDISEFIEITSFRGPFSPLVNWIAAYEVGEKVQPFCFHIDI